MGAYPGESVDLRCALPECGKVLNGLPLCPRCGAESVTMLARYDTGDHPIRLCSRKGCRWHEIETKGLGLDTSDD